MRLQARVCSKSYCPVCGKDSRDMVRAERDESTEEFGKWYSAFLAREIAPNSNILITSMAHTIQPWGIDWCAHGHGVDYR
jgi:hypothetical protein